MTNSIRVWDPLLRVFHWGLVVAFAGAWLTSEESQQLHEIAGYAVIGLLAFRLIWGLAGSRYARFAQFVRGPSATLSYAGDMLRGRERRYVGHNPAGAVMVVVLLLTLAGTAYTGWLMENPGRRAALPALPQLVTQAFADEEGEEEAGYGGSISGAPVEEIHETLANLLLLLVALHVGGVIYASVRHRENLARAMVTGLKRAPEAGDVS